VVVEIREEHVTLVGPAIWPAPRVDGRDPPLHSDRIGVTEVVCYFVFEEGDEIARDGMSNPHDQGILRLVDKLVDPLWLSRTGKGDSPAVNIAPPRNFDFGISPMLPHGKDAVCRVGAIRFIRQVDRRRGGRARNKFRHYAASN